MHKSSFMQMVLGYIPRSEGYPTFFPGDNCTGHCSTTVSSTIGFGIFSGYIPSAEGYIPKSLADI